MRCLLPVTVYCISLFTLQQLLALPLANRPQRSLDILLGRPSQQLEGTKVLEEDAPSSSSSSSSAPSSDGVHDADSVHPTLSPASLWRVLLVKGAPLTETGVVAVTDNLPSPIADTDIMEPKRRGRRQVNGGSRGHHPHLHGHPQLMRVGCVLGTCQVQNLSHRLYQLNGQMGRDDSSPINPRSPHSYG